ncbi:uncharacterized protein [Temnothorax nylanderi]|uniref:uncharacterized protein n=1 Tax=Temnothorax nylanderi TaxID=102681 RepID=UPI003A889A4D
MVVDAASQEVLTRRREIEASKRRWALKKLSPDHLRAAVIGLTWADDEEEPREDAGDEGAFDVDDGVDRLRNLMSRACDAAMPRVKRLPPKRAMYWWTDAIAELRPWTPPLTETLDPQFAGRVVDTLFPEGDGGAVLFPEVHVPEWDEELRVPGKELERAIKRVRQRKAPGPDGIPGRAWVLVAGGLADRLQRIYTACLKAGRFPKGWKRASLVLLPKVGKPADSQSAYCPICLLDEVGKIFERIIAERLVQQLSRREGRGISDDQFGFRAGRSTIDAITRIIARVGKVTSQGGVFLGVGFDVQNPFNSLPWPVIGEALLELGVSPYMVRVIADYFRDRGLMFTDGEGVLRTRVVGCGVPQGFGTHVARAVPKAKAMANSLARLLPNLGGAGGRVRRLYAMTVHSVLLYGAPIWAEKVAENPALMRQLVGV